MLTNRRSTMMIPPSRRPSWQTGSKAAPALAPPTYVADNDMPHSSTPSLLITTTESLPGHTVTHVVGSVHGTMTCARKDPKSFLKSIASSLAGPWGESKPLTSALYQARDQAIERMTREAVGHGANAVVGLNIRESEIMGCIVVSVSATACLVERTKGPKRDSAQESVYS
jgi:uncharacterized protein YbjQ (UPF0145 family)